MSSWFAVFFVTFSAVSYPSSGFNVDVRYPLIYHQQAGSFFGYSVQLMRNSLGNHMLLVGAPAGNSSYDTSSYQPGVVFSCSVVNDRHCQELYFTHKRTLITDPNFEYVELRNSSWLGVAVDVSQDGRQFVACGHLWKNTRYPLEYLANGICYVHNADFTPGTDHILMPLINGAMQVIDRMYIYALGLAGMSAHFASDGKYLLMGAPGVQQLTGSVISVPMSDFVQRRFRPDQQYNFNIPVPNDQMTDDSYFGYAITSGKFYNDSVVYYVGGAPREGVNGMVFIYKMPEIQNDQVEIKTKINGEQMGEYFGSSLCAVDINNDGLSDLLVGAPFHSFRGDEGVVYVYMSGRQDVLVGSKVANARFGTSIAAIGDLNLDGFPDVAVGAPYEGNGAVYVYRGGPEGLKESQRILAADVFPDLRGFGISISKGRDIDGNAYSDFAVGAHVSGSAVILRTQPIIQATASLSFDVNHINTNNKSCEDKGQAVACFRLNVCTKYDGQRSQDSLDFQVHVNADVLKTNDLQKARVYIFGSDGRISQFNFVVSLRRTEVSCRPFNIFVKDDVVDFLTPVEFQVSVLSDDSRSKRAFCKDCPVIEGVSATNVTKQVSFLTGCKDDHCISDLTLKAEIVGYGEGSVLLLGEKEKLQLAIEVSNEGDPAHQATLNIIFPPKVDFARIPSACSSYIENMSLALLCNLGNPLDAGRPVELDVFVDVKSVSTDVLELPFNITVSTVSDETEESRKDNTRLIVLPVKAVADLSVKGWQVNEDHVYFNRSYAGVVLITHVYEVAKFESSPITNATLTVQFPISAASATSPVSFLMKPLSMDVLFYYQPVINNCEEKVVNPSVTTVQHVKTEHGSAAVFDCQNMHCYVKKCLMGPLVKQDVAKINITAFLDLSVLMSLSGPSEIFELRSSASVDVLDKHVLKPTVSGLSNEAVVATMFLPQDLAPQPSSLPIWVIPLAILCGLLLLTAIAAVMYKLGFFKRETKDMMHSALTQPSTSDESLHDDDGAS